MIKSEQEALEVLTKWLQEHGYKGVIEILTSYGLRADPVRGSYYDFDMRGLGVFFVIEADGKVEDNHKVFG